jgi:nucleoside-diphosphate-sugar epimerase
VKILITGNLGYVGPSVTRQLRSAFAEADLVGLDTGYFSHCLTAPGAPPEAQLNAQYYVDIRSVGPELLENVDTIVHLAAISTHPMEKDYGDLTLDINCDAGIRLARLAKRAGVRSFVFASSCSVYGVSENRPRTENSPLRPSTIYARSKALTESGLRDLADENFRVSCLRFATACGMSDRLRLDLVLNDFVASAVATGRIIMMSNGSPWRPLIDVRDMARAVEWAVERDSHQGGHFVVVNVGSEEWNYRLRQLAEAVASVIPATEVLINHAAPPDRQSHRIDFSLFRRLAPSYQPQADLQGTIESLRNGLAQMYFDDANFRHSQWIRLEVLKDLQRRHLLSPTLEWLHRRAVSPIASVGKQRRGEEETVPMKVSTA